MSPAFQSMASRMRKIFMRKDPAAKNFEKLADGWDEMSLRHGDKVARAEQQVPTGPSWTHGNTYTISGLLKSAFCEVGKMRRRTTKVSDLALDQGSRGLETMLTVAALAKKAFTTCQLAWSRSSEVESSPALVLNRFFDSTPVLLRYGNLGGHVGRDRALLEIGGPTSWGTWAVPTMEDHLVCSVAQRTPECVAADGDTGDFRAVW